MFADRQTSFFPPVFRKSLPWRALNPVLVLGLALAACGGGGAGGGGGGGGMPSTAVATSTIPAGDVDCPYGGILVQSGIDDNGNGLLDPEEVDVQEKVCHGDPGAAGATPNGAPAADGGGDQQAFIGDLVTLAGAGNDPDGDALSLGWRFLAAPHGSSATLSGADGATATFVPDAAGDFVFLLTVSDGALNGLDVVVVTAGFDLLGGAVQAGDLNLQGSVTTFAGPPPGVAGLGSVDSVGGAARFNQPIGITTDGANLYVTEYANHTIRRIVIATGGVTTLAGLAGTPGDADGTGGAARFLNPHGITTDGTNLYVAEDFNFKIRKIVIATGEVTTLAGPAPGTVEAGDADGVGTAARFNRPVGITTDGTDLYVVELSNNKIRKVVIATGEVTTLAGPAPGTVEAGDADGVGAAARFFVPVGITTDGTDLYVADFANHKIRKVVISTGEVTTLAGPAPGTVQSGDADGAGTAARFANPHRITTDGVNLYVADRGNHKIRRIVITTGEVTTLAGPAPGTVQSGDADGIGAAARFNNPSGITTDGGSLFVPDQISHKIRRID